MAKLRLVVTADPTGVRSNKALWHTRKSFTESAPGQNRSSHSGRRLISSRDFSQGWWYFSNRERPNSNSAFAGNLLIPPRVVLASGRGTPFPFGH